MVDRHERELLYLLERNKVLVVVGETGSGKSTRIPEILFKAGIYNQENDVIDESSWLAKCHKHQLIGVTEPRRVAATQLAQRVASNLKCPLGSIVGYAIRFEDVSSTEHTQIKFMTEGLLLREMIHDPLLNRYSVLMIDEAHERNINTDIILGALKSITQKRSDIKIIICSATLEVGALIHFFTEEINDNGPRRTPAVLSITNRSYPVEIYHTENSVSNYLDTAVNTVKDLHESYRLATGNILVFLTGQDEVEHVCERLNDYAYTIESRLDLKKLIVLPLHSSLKQEMISKVFEDHGKKSRVCIVSTNIAEMSLTIEGISSVIDCGFVKLKFYDHKTGIESLLKVPISKGAAKQRAGRAGRTGKGFVYRLYPYDEYLKLDDHSVPEIQRSPLAETVILLKSLGYADLNTFPLLSPMPRANLCATLESLYTINAIDDTGKLTKEGRLMAQFNLNPQLSKMLISSESTGCTKEICHIVAFLQVKEIYLKPPRHKATSLWVNENLARLCTAEGDMISYLNMLNGFLSNHSSDKWAEKRCINHRALRDVLEISGKLQSQLKNSGISITDARGRTETVQKAVLSGLYANAAYLHPYGDYKTIRGDQTVYIHPTSVFSELSADDRPKYVIFAEILNTTKPYMRHIMSIERDWLLAIAPHYYRFGTEIDTSRGRY